MRFRTARIFVSIVAVVAFAFEIVSSHHRHTDWLREYTTHSNMWCVCVYYNRITFQCSRMSSSSLLSFPHSLRPSAHRRWRRWCDANVGLFRKINLLSIRLCFTFSEYFFFPDSTIRSSRVGLTQRFEWNSHAESIEFPFYFCISSPQCETLTNINSHRGQQHNADCPAIRSFWRSATVAAAAAIWSLFIFRM